MNYIIRSLLFSFLFYTTTLWADSAKAMSSDPQKNIDQGIEIDLSRPDKVGEKFRIDAIVDRTVNVRFSDTTGEIKEDKIECRSNFSAEIEVLAISQRKIASHIRIKILNMVANDASISKAMTILDPGTELEAKLKNGKTTFYSNGNEISQVQSQELLLFLNLDEGNPTDTDIIGGKALHKVGEKWNINPKMAQAQLSGLAIDIPEKSIKGTTTFSKITKVKSIDYGMLETLIESNKINSPTELPEGVTPTQSGFVYNSTTYFPIIPSNEAIYSESASLRVTIAFKSMHPSGAVRFGSQITEIRQRASITPIQK